MSKLRGWLRFSGRSEEGATAVEYGIMVALIAAVIIGLVAALGDQISAAFTDTTTTLEEEGGYSDGDSTTNPE